MAAIAATVTAAYFSVTGWAVIFPGEPIGAMAFDAVMETLKIAAAGFLAACWRTVLPFWRVALMCFIIAVAGINGLGVYSQLVAAHISDRTVASTDAAATANREVVRLTALVISQRAAVENVSQQIRTHDDAVAKATTARPKAAMQIIADSRAARDKLTTQYEAATKALTMWAGIAPGAEYPVGARDQARQREAG